MDKTIYSEPTQEQIKEAEYQKKVYKAIYHNGKLNHWQLTKIQEAKKPCAWCGTQRNNI